MEFRVQIIPINKYFILHVGYTLLCNDCIGTFKQCNVYARGYLFHIFTKTNCFPTVLFAFHKLLILMKER